MRGRKGSSIANDYKYASQPRFSGLITCTVVTYTLLLCYIERQVFPSDFGEHSGGLCTLASIKRLDNSTILR